MNQNNERNHQQPIQYQQEPQYVYQQRGSFDYQQSVSQLPPQYYYPPFGMQAPQYNPHFN